MPIVRHTYEPDTPDTALPFVADIDGRRYWWHVPPADWHDKPADNYVSACDEGRQFACDFIEFLKNAEDVGSGLTAKIFRAMAKIDEHSPEAGYAVGFACVLERALCLVATNTDYYGYEQRVLDWQEEEMRKLGYSKPGRKKTKRKD